MPAAALADRLQMTFHWELSKGTRKNPPPGSYFVFEGITIERDRLLALRPPPPAETTAEDIAELRQDIDELKARPGVPTEDVAKLQAQVARLTANASEDIAKVQQEVANLKARLPPEPKGAKRGPKGYSAEELKPFEVKFYQMLNDDDVQDGANFSVDGYAERLVDWGEGNSRKTPARTKMRELIEEWWAHWLEMKSFNR